MSQSLLRLATGSLLLSVALCASAGNVDSPYLDLQVAGVMQEIPGPAARCASGMGGNIAGYGDAGAIGRVAFLSSDCFAPSGAGFRFSEGHFLITTATGELLFANYSGQAVPSGLGTNVVFSGASFQISGGTGKYAKASGGGDLTGNEDMATGKGTIQLSGRLLLKH